VKLEIVAVDRLRASWARAALEEYLGRVGRYVPVERRDVKRAGDDEAAVKEEGARLLRSADPAPGDRVVALAPGGEVWSSRSWARVLAKWANTGTRRIVFLVGGAGGLSRAVVERADRVVSLGPQTMAHELAQVVLAEQLYRAWTIVRGEPYHK